MRDPPPYSLLSHSPRFSPQSVLSPSDNPSSISISAKQFETFEHLLNNSSSSPVPPLSDDRVADSHIVSTVNSFETNAISRSRFNPPVLINTCVQNFDEPMDIDKSAEHFNRKRALPSSSHSSPQKELDTQSSLPSVSKLPKESTSPLEKDTNLYSSSDNPSFLVHVHSISDNSLNPSHPLLISRTLSKLAYSDIKEIKKLGRGKVLVEMSSAKSANNLIFNPILAKENLKAFIPVYRTIRSGIIKDIPQHYDDADLLEFMDSPFKVVEIKRLNRRIRIDSETKFIPSRTVCLKFSGQILPKYVFLCRNRYEVFPFVPKIKICYSCYRVGHISKACKGKSRCIFCGNDPHENDISCLEKNKPPKCINCQGEHLASSHDCPIVSRHKMVLSLAASENIPLVDARRKIHLNNASSSDPRYDFVNFPLLSNKHSARNSFKNATGNSHSVPLQVNNHFSVLSSSSNENEVPSCSPSCPTKPYHSSSHRKPIVNKKSPFSQNPLIAHNNNFSRSSSNTQENSVVMSDPNPLLCPNGRSPNLSRNGVCLSVDPINRASSPIHSLNNISSSPLQLTHPYFDSYGPISDLANTDFGALNSILKLTSSVDLIYNLFLSLNSSIANSRSSNIPQSSSLN